MNSKESEKKILRKQVSLHKKQLSPAQKYHEVAAVFNQIEYLPAFQKSENIICYWSLPDELATHEFVQKWYNQKKIFLPRVIGNEVELVRFRGLENMREGAFGISEPIGDAYSELEHIDFVLVPGVAYTKEGLRMGRGGGYYDRLLPQLINSVKVGVSYSCQIVNDLPVEQHDVRMDFVIYSDRNV